MHRVIANRFSRSDVEVNGLRHLRLFRFVHHSVHVGRAKQSTSTIGRVSADSQHMCGQCTSIGQHEFKDFCTVHIGVESMRRDYPKCRTSVAGNVVECELTSTRTHKVTNFLKKNASLIAQYIFKVFLEKYKKAQQQLHASRNSEQNWSLLQTCISLLQNIGDFTSQLSEFGNTIADRLLQLEQIHLTNDKAVHFGYKIKEKRELNEFRKLIGAIRLKNDSRAADEDNPSATFTVFVPTFEVLKPICEYAHDTTLASIFSPIEKYLTTNVEPPESLNSSDQNLPDYSFAPQEFITQVSFAQFAQPHPQWNNKKIFQIGQYLLTLPQHLEPLLLSPSVHLKTALDLCDTKYTQNIPSTDVLLSLLVDECCAMYEEQITKICQLSPIASKQIATDIEYLGNVLEELGLPLSNRLRQTVTLLRAPPETYLSSSAGCDPKLVSSIRQMRNIISG